MSSIHRNLNYPDNQRGWVLVVGLVILVMLTILSMALMKTTRLEEKMAGATRDMNLSFQAAETALRAAETFIESKTDESIFDTTDKPNGIYSQTDDEPEDLFTLVWDDTNSAIAEKLEGVPLKLVPLELEGVTSNPRYMITKTTTGYGEDNRAPTVFRVTARGTGGTNNRATLLRSHYAKVFGDDSAANAPEGPIGINEGIKLWLDANKRYLFSDSNCSDPTLDSENNVSCWKDRSRNNAHVKRTRVKKNNSCPTLPCQEYVTNPFHGVPQYQRDNGTLNDKPYLLFNKSGSGGKDALAHNLPTSWEGAHSLFLVVQQHTDDMRKYSSYFSNGQKHDLGAGGGSQFQVACVTGRCRADRGWIAYATQVSNLKFAPNPPGVNQTRIYTIRNDYDVSSVENKTTTYIDGEETIYSDTANLHNFTRYLIGLNRNVDKWNNFRLAELVLYGRALDNCELRDIHEYLTTKYGVSSKAEGCPAGRLSWEQLFPSQ